MKNKYRGLECQKLNPYNPSCLLDCLSVSMVQVLYELLTIEKH